MHKVFLGIGGNIGNKQKNFKEVCGMIENNLGKIEIKSSVYETPPWGFKAEEDFWNQVICIETQLSPLDLLAEIQSIEEQFGRVHSTDHYSSREMDIDILYYDDDFVENEWLVIPHPRIAQRKFVLVPLVEIAPDFKHPLLRLTSIEMLENCKDGSVIKKVDEMKSNSARSKYF